MGKNGSGSGYGKKKETIPDEERRRLTGKKDNKSGFFRSGGKDSDDADYPEKKMSNVFKNAILPLDFRKGKVVQGTLVYVTAEVLVSKILRKIMKADNTNIFFMRIPHGGFVESD